MTAGIAVERPSGGASRRSFGFAAASLALVLGVSGCQAQSNPEHITIQTSSGSHEFTVEWAVTAEETQRGLMFREQMDADHGMVFDFKDEAPRSFWMRNTILPLDMIFIKADGTVYRIAEDTVPFSDAAVPSGGPVRYVLEVNAGTSDRISLDPGDHIDLN